MGVYSFGGSQYVFSSYFLYLCLLRTSATMAMMTTAAMAAMAYIISFGKPGARAFVGEGDGVWY